MATIGFLSCATPPKPATANPLPPLPRSSIAALLESRVELQLTDAQVTELSTMDEELERVQAPLREQLTTKKKAAVTNDHFADVTPASGRRGHGQNRGGAMQKLQSSSPHDDSIREKIDENDTEAYERAETALEEQQRPRAREIASKYRADLWDRRQAEGH